MTGATSGIGRATAIALGKQGATVVVTGRREKEGRETLDMLRAAGGDGAFIQLDVSVEGEVMGAVREIMARHGRLDCAANCAGHDIAKPLTEYSEADYDAIFNPNVKGLLFCLKHEILAMRDNGGTARSRPRNLVKREVAKLLAILGEPDFVLASQLELIAGKG